MSEFILQERNGLIWERTVELNALESPGLAIASLVGMGRGPAFYRNDALGFGVAGAPGHTTASDLDAIQCTSQAAAQGIQFTNVNVPLHKNPASFPARYRTRRRYVFEAVVNVTVGPAATPAAMGLHATINDLNGSAASGLEWFAGSGVNAGRWTVRYRRTAAPTVITNVADSGVLADATLRCLAIVFREDQIAVDFYLDNTLVTTITDPVSIKGDATVINSLPSICTGAGAGGTTFNIFDARLRVFDPDFPLYPSEFASRYPGV